MAWKFDYSILALNIQFFLDSLEFQINHENIHPTLTIVKVASALTDCKTFIECSNHTDDIYKKVEEYNPNKKRKILIIFDDVIADMLSNSVIRLNSAHYFIMKIPNKREVQQLLSNYSSNIDFEDFMNVYKKSTAKPYSCLVTDAALASDDPLRFKKHHLERI